MTLATSHRISTSVLAVNEANSSTPETKKSANKEKAESLPFFNPLFFQALLNEGVLSKDLKLVCAPTLPPCTARQIDAFVDLIDSPFDLMDNCDGTPVLKQLSVRIVLKLIFETAIFKSANILKQMRLAGGAVTQVLESDMDWFKTLFSLFTKSDVSHFLCAFPKRDLPDIDIHLICSEKSHLVRRKIISQLLNSLGNLLILNNKDYLEREIDKLSQLELSKCEVWERDIIVKALEYKNFTAQKRPNDLLSFLAPEIIRRNCLKKISNNPFGSIIAFGKIELVLTENPSYLLTPDKIDVIFDLNIQKGTEHALTLYPSDHSCAQALAHRGSKLAVIDLDPTEHTFTKACIYMTFGYHVPQNSQFELAITRFIRHIYSHSTNSLTIAGLDFLRKYDEYHFRNNPEDGLCTLINVCRFLEKSGDDYVIPMILKKFNNLLNNPLPNPYLNRIRLLLLKFPNHFSTIAECINFFHEGMELNCLNERFVAFKTQNGFSPYLLRTNFIEGNAFDILRNKNKDVIEEIFLDLCEFQQSSTINPKKLLEALTKIRTLTNAYILLLSADKSFYESDIVKNFPTVYFSLTQSNRQKLIIRLKDYFKDSKMNLFLDICSNNIANQENLIRAWILHLASYPSFCNASIDLWINLNIKNPSFDIELATAILGHNIQGGFRVIQKSLLNLQEQETTEIRNRTHQILQDLLNSNSPLLTKDLCNLIPDIFIWLLQGFITEAQTDLAKSLIISTERSYPVLKSLRGSKIQFWPFISLPECLNQLSYLEKEKNTPKLIEGITYLQSQLNSLTNEQIEIILNVILKVLSNSETNEHKFALLNLTFPFCRKLQQTNEGTTQFIPLLIKLNKSCLALHTNSQKIIFLGPLKEASVLLFRMDLTKLLSTGITTNQLVTHLAALLKDSSRPLEEIKDAVSSFIEELLPKLKDNEHEIDVLIKALNASSLSFLKSKELNEAKSLYEIRHSDRQATTDVQVHKLFNPQNRPSDNLAYEKELLSYFKTLLEDDKISILGTFLTCARAYRADFDFAPYAQALFSKLKSLCSKETSYANCFELIDMIFKNHLHALYAKSFDEICRFINQLKDNDKVKNNWENLYRIYCLGNKEVRKVLLPLLIQHVSKKHLKTLFDIVSKQIIEDKYPDLDTFEEINECIIKFLEILGTFKSKYLLSLIDHRNLIEKRLLPTQVFPIFEKWILSIMAVMHDPINFDRNETSSFLSFYSEVCSENSEEFGKLFWGMCLFLARSTKPIYFLDSWYFLKGINEIYSKYPDNFNSAYKILLKKVELKDYTLRAEDEELFIRTSELFRKAYEVSNETPNEIKNKFKEISPVDWMRFLLITDGINLLLEAVHWIPIYLGGSQLTESGVKLCIDIIICLQKDEDYETEDLHHVSPILHLLTQKVRKFRFTKVEEKLTSAWQTQIDLQIDIFIENPNIKNARELSDILHIVCTTAPCDIPIHYESLDLVESLLDLINEGEVSTAITLWNALCLVNLSDKHPPLNVIYQSNPIKALNGDQLIFSDNSDIEIDHRKKYAINLTITINSIYKYLLHSTPPSERIQLFLFDWAFNCMHFLIKEIIFQSKIRPNKEVLFTSFRNFVDLVGKKNGKAFKIHCSTALPQLSSELLKAKAGFENRDLFFELATLTRFHVLFRISGLSSIERFVEQRKKIQQEMEKVLSEQLSPECGAYAYVYQISLLAKAVESNMLHDHTQFVRFIKATVDYLKTPLIVEAAETELEEIIGLPIFVENTNKFNLDHKCSDSEDPPSALKECYMALFDGYLEALKVKRICLIPAINWVEKFKANCFKGCSVEYIEIMKTYSDTINELIKATTEKMKGEPPAKSFKAFLPYLNKFFEFLNFANLSSEEQSRREQFILEWLGKITAMNLPISPIIIIQAKKALNLI